MTSGLMLQACSGAPGPLRLFGGVDGVVNGLLTQLFGEAILSGIAILIDGVQDASV